MNDSYCNDQTEGSQDVEINLPIAINHVGGSLIFFLSTDYLTFWHEIKIEGIMALVMFHITQEPQCIRVFIVQPFIREVLPKYYLFGFFSQALHMELKGTVCTPLLFD